MDSAKKEQDIKLIVKVNYKYFVKAIYKFINELIDVNMLLEELKFFKTTTENEDRDTLEKLIKTIENIETKNGKEKGWALIYDLLINQDIYKNYAKQMTDKDIMLLITNYIYCPNVPKVTQETFNNIVMAAIHYENPLEDCWRIAMNYDLRGYDFSLLDEFFVRERNAWYFSEYVSGVKGVDIKKLIDMAIKTKDSVFIKELINDNFLQSHLDKKYMFKLKEAFISLIKQK